jgi:hypothetical protein
MKQSQANTEADAWAVTVAMEATASCTQRRPASAGPVVTTSTLGPQTMQTIQTQLVGDFDVTTGKQVRDVPIGMEMPAKRPVTPEGWAKMTRDSLRPDQNELWVQSIRSKSDWVHKAMGRPPMQSWVKVYLFLQVYSTFCVTLTAHFQ